MADLSSTIDIIFRGINNTDEAVESVRAGLNRIGAVDIGNVGAQLTDLADRLIQMETVTLAASAAMVGLAISAAGDFDTAFREIATLVDEPIEGLQRFRGEILAYAATSTQSLDSVTKAIYNAISQGVSYENSLTAISVAEKLAVAGKADLNVTLQGLLGTLNAYGQGMEQAGAFSDVFFTTVRLGKTTIPELATLISGVTSTAVLGGVKFGELGAAIATVTAAGAGTSEAITRINAVLSAIIKPSKEASDLAKSLGIEFDIQALKSKGLAGVLGDVAVKTGGAGDKMAVLFGSTEALNAANVLAVSSSDKFKANLEAMGHAAGATDAAFGKMKDATDTLAQAIQVALVTFGSPMLDSFNAAEDAVAELAVAFIKAANAGAFKDLQVLVNQQLNGIASAIQTMAKNLPAAFDGLDFSGLTDALADLGLTLADLFKAFFGNIDLSTVDGLRAGLQTLVNTFELLTRVVTGIAKEFEPFFASAGEMVRHFNELDDASQLEFGQTLGAIKAITDAGLLLGGALIAIGKSGIAMGDALDVVFGGAQVLINALQVAFDVLAGAVVAPFALIAKGFIALSDALGTGDGAMKAQMQDIVRTFDAIGQNASKNADELRNGWNKVTGETAKETAAANAKLDAMEVALRAAGRATATAGGEQKIWADGVSQGVRAIEEHRKALQAHENDLKKSADGMKEAKLATIAWADTIAVFPQLQLPDGVAKIEGQFNATGRAAAGFATSLAGVATSYSQVGDGTVKATGAFKSVGNTAEKSAKQVDEATKKSESFLQKMEEIASNERIKNIEAVVSIKTAQLNADVKRVEAAFKSIDNTITSTGDLLGSLFGNLSGADFHARSMIENQIALENKRRQDALDLQKKLAEAEIERIEAQTSALNRGDSLIKIDGAGLKPELEAFMWKILSLIRVRANAEFSNYLLGVGAA